MKPYCLLIFATSLLFLGSCKGSRQAASTTDYTEDLSTWRIKKEAPAASDKTLDENRDNTGTGNAGISRGIEKPLPLPGKAVNQNIDEAIMALAQKNAEVTSTRGYRILVYSGSDREKAREIYRELMLSEEVDQNFDSPNWQVKAGSFLDRLQAHEKYIELKETYPQAIIIPQVIEVNPQKYLKDASEDEERG